MSTLEEKIKGRLEQFLDDTKGPLSKTYAFDAVIVRLMDLIEQEYSLREARLLERIKELNFEYMEECEPDCDAVRHAYHQGSWDHHWKMGKALSELKGGDNSQT